MPIPAEFSYNERADFGATASDFTYRTVGGLVRVASGSLTFYDAQTGGNKHTDLVFNGLPVTEVQVGANGQIPVFQGPPGVVTMWAEDGDEATERIQLVAMAEITARAASSAEEAWAAAGVAEEAADSAFNIGVDNDSAVAGALSTAGAARGVADARYRGRTGTQAVGQGELTINAADQTGANMGAKIGNAVKAAIALGTQHAEVFIPPGTHDVPANVFSDIASSLQTGLHIRGAGRESTRLRLVTGGVESWFYNNAASQRMQFMSFSDLCFTTDDATGQFGNGFKMTSTGHEQGWHFTNCVFRGPFRRVFQTEGTVGADTIYLENCRVLQVYGAVLYLNNPQSVLHQWTATNIELCYGDIVFVGPNGGGDVKWFGGSLIMTNTGGDTTPHWLFNVTPSNNVGSGNGTFQAWGVRAEMRSAYSGLVYSPGDLGGALFDFNGCNFAGFAGVPTGDHEVVVIGRDRQVRFAGDCVIPDEFTYRITVANGNGFNTNETGIIFDGSQVPQDLSDKVTLTNAGYGRFTARGCRVRNATPTERYAVDFDLNWANAAWGSWMTPTKRFMVKAALTAWPNTTGGERTVKLPKDAIITGVRVMKPATGAQTAAYQLAIGNGDKTVTYGTSAAAQHKDAHTILLTGQWIECGSSANGRTVRLWAASTGSSEAQIGGLAFIEYI